MMGPAVEDAYGNRLPPQNLGAFLTTKKTYLQLVIFSIDRFILVGLDGFLDQNRSTRAPWKVLIILKADVEYDSDFGNLSRCRMRMQNILAGSTNLVVFIFGV